MATYIDIVTGFLESGKTTFIKELLQSKAMKEPTRVLVICEEGLEEYDEDMLKKWHIKTIMLESEAELETDLFKNIEKKYDPDYILVEFNGTWDISKIIGQKTPSSYELRNIAFISETGNFNHQLCNMPSILQPHILNSDLVVFNRFETLDQNSKKKLIRDVKNINPRTRVTFQEDIATDNIVKERFVLSDSQENKSLDLKTNIGISVQILLCFALFFVLLIPSAYAYVQSIATVFLSILMQAIPFILLGAFISAIIQMFASTGWIMQQIAKGKWYSFGIAAVAGFFMPICDCGMVPIISGLLKKDMPLPQTITFWLSSSAVSPIVILSMLYAFQDQPQLAGLRVAIGLLLAIVAGLLLKLMKFETKNVIKENRRIQTIGKDVLELTYEGKKGKLEAVFLGAKVEFFRVAEYVIVGALISAVLQTLMPQAMKGFLGNNLVLQFAIMLVAAMLMSTCSTSNAFIGRSFSDNFSTVPILLFIVVGPMLDLKNLVMLSEVLKKRFLLILSTLIMIESAIVFGILAAFM
jgi:uncharacterized membrane protein YraQ (UPF0718 family)/Ni2+-binding GTPase involved in maturation of urease and hydrogenase